MPIYQAFPLSFCVIRLGLTMVLHLYTKYISVGKCVEMGKRLVSR